MAFDPSKARPATPEELARLGIANAAPAGNGALSGTRPATQEELIKLGLVQPEEATLGSAAAGGFEQLKSAWGTTLDAFTQDPNEVALRGIREQQRIAREQGVMPSFSRVGDVYEQQGVLPAAGQVISDAPTAAIGQAANIASTIGGGVLGAKIGSIAGPVGASIGAGIGATGASFPPLFAENLQAQAQEQLDRGEEVDVNRLKAGVTATGQAALETIATFATLGGNLLRRIIGGAATKTDAEKALVAAAQRSVQRATTAANRSLPGAVGAGVVRGTVAEMPVEVAQNVLTRAQAGADLFSEEALAEYGENAYLGGLVGGTAGGVAGPMDRGAARKTLQEAGVDYETGAPVQAEQSRQEREALVRQEQMNVLKGQERREIARREREAQWAQPVDVAASPEALTQELADLRAIADDKDSALRGPAVNSRIKRIEAALDIIQNEPARRARIAAQDTRNLSPALQAKRSAEVFMRDAVAQRSDAEIEQELAAIKGRRDPESEMLRNALRDELTYRTRKSRFDREQQVMTTVPTLDSAQLMVRKESLAKQKGRSYEDNFELSQINEELRQRRRQQRELGAEVKRIREQNEAARPDLLPVNRAQSAAEVFEEGGAQGELYFDPAALAAQPTPTTQTEDMPAGPGVRVRRAPFQGVGAKSTYGRQLGDLDLTNPDQFEQAQRIAATAQSDAKLSAQAKRNIQQYVDGFARQEPLPSQQGGLDFEAPATAVAPVFSQELAAQMGFGKNTLPFKSVGAQNLDPSDAKQRETLKEIIDTWFAQGSYKAQRPALQAYRQQLEQMDGGQDARPTTGTSTVNEVVEPGADTGRVAMAGRRQPSAGAPTPATTAVPSGPDRAGLEPTGQATDQPATAGVQPDGALESEPDILARAEQAVQAYPAKEAELAALSDRISSIDKAITDARLARSQASGPFSSAKVAEIDARLAQLMADKDRAEADWAAAGGLPDGLVNAMRSDARVLAQADGDTPGVLTTTLATRLELGDVQGALQHMADNADGVFNPMETLLARRVLDMRMTLPSVEVVPVIEQRDDGSVVAGQYDPATDTIRLAAGEADSHTFLHELVHAHTHKFLQEQQRSGYTNPNVKGLMDVYAHVLRMRPDLRAYGVTNVSEFAAEAMSNRQFQLQLMGIPYRKQTAWSWFAKAVKGFFGVKDADPVSNTAWAAIVHVDGLMRPGRQAQEAGVDLPNGVVNAVRTVLTPPGALTPDEIRNIPPASPQQHIEGFRMFGSGARQGTGVPARVTRVRAAIVDSMAPIADKMATVFNDGLRDAMGNINPLNFMRQAADAGRMSMEFFRRGGLRRRPDGYWEVYDLKDANGNPLSVMAVTDKLAAWGKANGLDYKGAKARAATVFEYLRLNDLRAYNAELEADAQAFEALNTAKGDAEADRLRSKMIALHGTDADIDARVSEFERSPELQEIRQILNETRFNAIDAMVASGRLSEEQGAMWKKNINYVPFNRVQEVFETSGITERIGRSGLADLGSIPAIKGSYRREVANSIDNYMHSLAWMVNQSLRNTASRETLDAMVDAEFATKLAGGPSEAENTKLVVTVYNEGKPVHYEMDNEYDMAAFSHNRLDTSSDAMRAFTALARIMRASITAMPTFSVNQVMQDTQRSSLQGGTRSALATAARTLTSFASEFKNAWVGKRSPTADRLHGVGIVGNVDFNPINPIDAIEYEAGVLKSGVGRRFLHTLEQVAKASDQAARQAVYERTMLETKDEALAITRAREVINYNRRGSSKFIQVLTHTVPFFNAYAQGMDLIYRGLTGTDSPTGFNKAQAKKYVGTRLAMMMALGTMYALAMSDDEDYENADQFVRDRAWILPRVLTSAFDSADGRHTPLAIPAPRDWGFIFKGIPERIVQYFKEREEGTGQTTDRAIGSAFKTMGREFLFEPIPTAVKPFLEHLTNYSFGFGRAIVPQSQANAPAAMQYGRTTSEFAKSIGRELNVSPLIVDNYLSNMFGIMGKQATIVADMMIDGNLPERPFDKVVAGTAVFTAPEVGNRPLTEFYELREKILEAGSVWSNFEKDPQLAQDLLQDRMKYLPWRSWAQSKTDQLATLRAVEEQVRFNEGIDMTPRERRMYLKELAEARNAIVADVGYVRNALESQE